MYALLGFVIVAVPVSVAQAHKAMVQLDAIDRERILTANDTQRVSSTLLSIGPKEAQVRAKEASLHLDGATAPMTEIQGKFDQYLDTVARRDGIGYAPSHCDENVSPSGRPGLEGIKCVFTVTGTYTQVLDATQRLTAEAPVLVDAQSISIARNEADDTSPNPTLAADLTVYLERVAATPAPTNTTAPTPKPTASSSPPATSSAEVTASASPSP